jgi:hypothetical protein
LDILPVPVKLVKLQYGEDQYNSAQVFKSKDFCETWQPEFTYLKTDVKYTQKIVNTVNLKATLHVNFKIGNYLFHGLIVHAPWK